MAMVLAVPACGPGSGEPARTTCGGDAPVQLVSSADPRFVDEPAFFMPTRVDDRVIVDATEFVDGELGRFSALAVDECGASTVELIEPEPEQQTIVGSAGRWALSSALHGTDVRWVDPHGKAPSHALFGSVRGCPLVVADGLAAVDAEGVLWFHPAPSDPDATARELVTDAIVPEYAEFSGGDLTDCWASDANLPVVDGDGILVAIANGPLVRISLPDGAAETLVEGPVGEFVVLDDPRYILWRGGEDGRDCCELHVFDRDTGESRPFASGTIPERVGWSGRWITTYHEGPFEPGVFTEEFVNVATGVSFEIEDWWDLEGALDDERMLVSRVGEESGTYLLDATRRVPEPIDFPVPRWGDPHYADGIVGYDREPDAEVGTLELLPFGGGPVERLADDIDSSYARLKSGIIVHIERESVEDDTGTLVYITRDGERTPIASGVYLFVVPFHGTEREMEEVLFAVRHADRGGLWRYVLP